MTATILDVGIVLIILISLVVGFIRGFVRESISLATWVAALAFALLYLKPLAAQLPFALQSEIARMGMAFAIIFFGVLVVGAIINYLLSTAIKAIGLGGVNQVVGALFGALRGTFIVILLVILMGVTSFPAQVWWTDSRLIGYFEEGAVWLKQWVPENLAEYVDKAAQYSGGVVAEPAEEQ